MTQQMHVRERVAESRRAREASRFLCGDDHLSRALCVLKRDAGLAAVHDVSYAQAMAEKHIRLLGYTVPALVSDVRMAAGHVWASWVESCFGGVVGGAR
jgi:hypothetical protein